MKCPNVLPSSDGLSVDDPTGEMKSPNKCIIMLRIGRKKEGNREYLSQSKMVHNEMSYVDMEGLVVQE